MSNHYTYRAEWSPEDGEYVGLVAEFPSLSWLDESPAEAIAGAARLVDEILADMAETGEKAPVPFTERRYSGNLSVRTSPAQHRALAIEAAEQGVSVNQWVNHKLAARPVEPPAPASDEVARAAASTAGLMATLLSVCEQQAPTTALARLAAASGNSNATAFADLLKAFERAALDHNQLVPSHRDEGSGTTYASPA